MINRKVLSIISNSIWWFIVFHDIVIFFSLVSVQFLNYGSQGNIVMYSFCQVDGYHLETSGNVIIKKGPSELWLKYFSFIMVLNWNIAKKMITLENSVLGGLVNALI